MTVRSQQLQGTRPPESIKKPGRGLLRSLVVRTRPSGVSFGAMVRTTDAALSQLAADATRTFQEIGRFINEEGRIGTVDALEKEIRTGLDRKVVTGTAGAADSLASWNSDGDAVDGGVSLAITTVSTNTTLDSSYGMVLVDASGGAVTITLPAVASNSGRRYSIKKIDSSANAVTVDGNASEMIDDSTTQVLASQYDAIQIGPDARSSAQLRLEKGDEEWDLTQILLDPDGHRSWHMRFTIDLPASRNAGAPALQLQTITD